MTDDRGRIADCLMDFFYKEGADPFVYCVCLVVYLGSTSVFLL
jgi:hypothetical protein